MNERWKKIIDSIGAEPPEQIKAQFSCLPDFIQSKIVVLNRSLFEEYYRRDKARHMKRLAQMICDETKMYLQYKTAIVEESRTA